MKITPQKTFWVMASFFAILLLVVGGINFFKKTGQANQQLEISKEYAVKYNQMPDLSEDTSPVLQKVEQDYMKTSIYLGLLLVVILGTSVVFYKFSIKGKTDKELENG